MWRERRRPLFWLLTSHSYERHIKLPCCCCCVYSLSFIYSIHPYVASWTRLLILSVSNFRPQYATNGACVPQQQGFATLNYFQSFGRFFQGLPHIQMWRFFKTTSIKKLQEVQTKLMEPGNQLKFEFIQRVPLSHRMNKQRKPNNVLELLS